MNLYFQRLKAARAGDCPIFIAVRFAALRICTAAMESIVFSAAPKYCFPSPDPNHTRWGEAFRSGVRNLQVKLLIHPPVYEYDSPSPLRFSLRRTRNIPACWLRVVMCEGSLSLARHQPGSFVAAAPCPAQKARKWAIITARMPKKRLDGLSRSRTAACSLHYTIDTVPVTDQHDIVACRFCFNFLRQMGKREAFAYEAFYQSPFHCFLRPHALHVRTADKPTTAENRFSGVEHGGGGRKC